MGTETEAATTAGEASRRGRSARVALALVVTVGGAIAVAVLVGSAGRSESTGDPGVPTGQFGEALDAVVMALLTLGLALTIALFIVQFGGEREEREPNSKRRLLGALLIPVILIGMLWLVREVGLTFDLGGDLATPEELEGGARPEGAGSDPEAEQDRSTVGSWTGIAFGVLVLAVGAVWMWAERRRRAIDDTPLGALGEREQLAGMLDLTIDELRDDPDPRRAVIRAWNQLSVSLASVGLERDEAEAPFPYLERVLADLDTSGEAATRLTRAFERALFSADSVDREMQLDAIDALAAVRDELRIVVS